MTTGDAKARVQNAVESLKELSECYADFAVNMKDCSEELKDAGRLWRARNKSRLIRLGLALIVFPEPTPVSETVGACLVATGAIQQAIKKRALFVEDVPKVYAKAIRDVITVSQNSVHTSP
jgi:hypothetical protein